MHFVFLSTFYREIERLQEEVQEAAWDESCFCLIAALFLRKERKLQEKNARRVSESHVLRERNKILQQQLEKGHVCVPTDTGDRVSCESQLTCPAIISYIRTPRAHQSTEKP